jgi:hypothetical protein
MGAWINPEMQITSEIETERFYRMEIVDMVICRSEIEKCQNLLQRPDFVLFADLGLVGE